MTDARNIHKGNKHDTDNFIMLPTVDICFKGLMNNPKVRKGFIAALLNIDQKTIREPLCFRQSSDRILSMTSWAFLMFAF